MRVKGSDLKPETQTEALRRYVHRFTGAHKPEWAYRSFVNVHGKKQAHFVQFKDDREWLEHTYFEVTKAGDLSDRVKYCESYPTWPYNPELRKENKS
jgi:hypothetical protein